MDSKKKKGCIIILILFILFFIGMCTSGIYMFRFALKEGENQNKRDSIKNVENVRFENLPVIKAVILNADSIKTPFSKKNVNVCFMNFGLTNSYKANHFKNSTSRKYVTTFSDFSTFYKRNHIDLLIEGKKYVLNSDELVLTNIFSDSERKDKIGILGTKFSTDMDYDKLLFLNNYEFYKKYSKTTLKQEKEYLDNVKIFCTFKNTNDHINCYYLTRFHKKDIPELCDHQTGESFHLREYIYNQGDTISFKGKIVNDKIVLLY